MNGHDIDRIVTDCIRALRANGENERADKLGEAFIAERTARDEARRLLDEARKQEPVAYLYDAADEDGFDLRVLSFDADAYDPTLEVPCTPLYAAPVPAQPAVPDDHLKVPRWVANAAKFYYQGYYGDYSQQKIDDIDAILSATEGRSNG